jgi:hypothetical protein
MRIKLFSDHNNKPVFDRQTRELLEKKPDLMTLINNNRLDIEKVKLLDNSEASIQTLKGEVVVPVVLDERTMSKKDYVKLLVRVASDYFIPGPVAYFK